MSGVPLALLAATPKADRAFTQSIEFWVSVGLLVLILLVGAIVLYFTDVWRKRQLAPGRDSTEALSTFREMYERGEITEAEYHAVRDRVAAQMRQEVMAGRPGAPVATSPEPTSGAEPARPSHTGSQEDVGGAPAGADGRPPEPPPR